jgi:hypothetical protein
MWCLDHVVLNVAPDAVLRAEQGPQIYQRMVIKEVGCMLELVIYRCLVAHKTNTSALKPSAGIFKKPLKP